MTIKKLFLLFCTADYLIASQDVLESVDKPDKSVEIKHETRKMALDFTPLPYDLQRLVLGYVSHGWLITKTVNYGVTIDDLFYNEQNMLLAEKAKKVIPVNFEGQVPREVTDKPRIDRNDLGWPWCFWSKHFFATQHSQRILFRPRRSTHVPYKRMVISEITTPYRFDNNALAFPRFTNIQISPCEKYCAVSANGCGENITFWDLKQGRLLQEIKNQGTIKSLAVSKDITCIAAGLDSNQIVLYQIGSDNKLILEVPGQHKLREAHVANHDQSNGENGAGTSIQKDLEVTAVAFSPCGKFIVSGTNAGHVHQWEYQPDVSKLA